MDYVAAKGDGNKHLDVEAFAEMIPYDYMCGHINYARWGITDVSEKKDLDGRKAKYFSSIREKPECHSAHNKTISVESGKTWQLTNP